MTRRGPEFEPVFGSRGGNGPPEPRLRDRCHDAEADPGGDVDELVGGIESHRTVGDDDLPYSAPHRVTPGRPRTQPSSGSRAATGPAIPADAVPTRSSIAIGADASSDRVVRPSMVRTRSNRIRRRLLAGFGLAAVSGLVYFLVSLAQVWSTGRNDDRDPVDAIVVMGAAQYDGRPSPLLAARLDHVVELWPEGVAPLVVVTGGKLPGDRFTEAEASAEYLIERGVPSDALLLENSGTNSFESLETASEMLNDRGLDDVVIVTDPYHSLRSELIAEEVGLDADVSSTDTSVVTGLDSVRRHVLEAGGVAVGRVIGFDRLSTLTD